MCGIMYVDGVPDVESTMTLHMVFSHFLYMVTRERQCNALAHPIGKNALRGQRRTMVCRTGKCKGCMMLLGPDRAAVPSSTRAHRRNTSSASCWIHKTLAQNKGKSGLHGYILQCGGGLNTIRHRATSYWYCHPPLHRKCSTTFRMALLNMPDLQPPPHWPEALLNPLSKVCKQDLSMIVPTAV